MTDVTREAALRRLEDAEPAVRRALQTIERHVHLAKSDSDDDPGLLLSTADRELELGLETLRQARSDPSPAQPDLQIG